MTVVPADDYDPLLNVRLPAERINAFCERWKVSSLAVFGSVLREDFGPDSDADVLVEFRDDARWGLWDVIRAEEELSELVGRTVDLVERRAVERSENWIRRRAILESAQRFMADDSATILDLLVACRRIERFVTGVDATEFAAREEKCWAVVSQLMLIGEGVRRLSPEFCNAHPVIPWKLVAGMRNQLIHEYD
ncbi:MAG: nucleotidyltransferase domain-containing protein [Planctomycetaceae bacterium]|nr:nucleotidyltransferase domain-containing protein [Planctomycetaceae bacterium]